MIRETALVLLSFLAGREWGGGGGGEGGGGGGGRGGRRLAQQNVAATNSSCFGGFEDQLGSRRGPPWKEDNE